MQPAGSAPAHPSADPSAPGPHPVAYSEVRVEAAGRSFTARVWYPGSAAGKDKPVASGAHPALAFGHGFLQGVSKYESLVRHYASWGLISVAPTSHGGPFPHHSRFADDLNAALTWLVAQNGTDGSLFENAVATRQLALSGHSMGAGSAILAAQRNPAVTTLSLLAAAETNPSAATAAAQLAAPAQFLAGSDDTIARPEQHQRKIYAAKPAPTQLRTVHGGFHCGFMDSGGLGCDSGAVSRQEQLRLTRGMTTAWLLYHLRGEQSWYDQVWGAGAQSLPGVDYEAKLPL
ncbi:alpha/beta hydrolase family protein [Streptomyces sp. NPDC059720]|uniref:alpha/beta hydrolase family protein n=1 Tax=Streptomyces sp. NPDC059720 TaxID=3346924 RepID=UPI003675EA46